MSAQEQERKEAGATAPVTPQKPEGGFSRFLRKLFDVPSESQPTQQSAPRIIQPPPGLEDFAAQIQQGVNEHLSAQRQQELDRQKAEAAKIAAEVEKQAITAQRKRDLEDRERITREEAITEAAKVLKDFRIAERLEYIRDTVWEGKGKINPVESKFGIKIGEKRGDMLGGFELVFRYPSVRFWDEWHTSDSDGVGTCTEENFYNINHTYGHAEISEDLTILAIDVLNLHGDSGNGEKVLRVDGCMFLSSEIPTETKDGEAVLEAALIRESISRAASGNLPSMLEKSGIRKITRFKNR